ncbi:S-layer homology domain-containing protein [bacterium]|nr:S-layer homology domain-containing protein [bacterium]
MNSVCRQILLGVFLIGLNFASPCGAQSTGPFGSPSPISGVVVETLDGSLGDKFTLYSPSTNWVTSQNRLIVKGINRLLTPVYVNGKFVPLRKDGRFFAEIPCEPGLQSTFITFELADGKHIVTIKRHGYRYSAAPSKGALDWDPEVVVNLKLAGDISTRSLSSSISRGEFADYLSKVVVSGANRRIITRPLNVDLDPPVVGGAVDWVVNAGFMDAFPDNDFRGDSDLSVVEYAVAMVKVTRQPLLEVPLPKKVSIPKWVWRYLNSAQRAGFLNASQLKSPTASVSLATVGLGIRRLPQYELLYQLGAGSLKDSDSDRAALKKHLFAIVDHKTKSMATTIAAKSVNIPGKSIVSRMSGDQPISDIRLPDSRASIATPTTPVSPSTRPISDLTLTAPEPKVHSYLVADSPSQSSQLVSANQSTHRINDPVADELTVTGSPMSLFLDIKGHWIEGTAQRMLSLRLLDHWPVPEGKPTGNFYPKSPMSKGDFLTFAVDIFGIPDGTSTGNRRLPDVLSENGRSVSINQLVAASVINGNRAGRLQLARNLTRIEALVILQRLSGYQPEPPVDNGTGKDSNRNAWYTPYVERAIAEKWISAGYYSPNSVISRAELLALVAKMPVISQRLKGEK